MALVAEAANSVAEPANSVAEHSNSVAQPAHSAAEPGDSMADSANCVAERSNSVAESAHRAADLDHSAAEPADSVAECSNSVTESAHSAAEPGDSTVAPANSVAEPSDSAAEGGDSVAESIPTFRDTPASPPSGRGGDGLPTVRFSLVDDRPLRMVHEMGRVRTRTMQNTRATVKEIARLAGVSIGTVDRVLHDRGEVSADTKAKIHAIIATLGYEPNILARQLARNRAYTFRAILPRADQDSGYWSLCLAGIRRAEHDLAPYGARLKVDEFDRYDRASYRALLKDVVAEPCDGLLIAPVLPDDLLPALARLSGPAGAGQLPRRTPYVFFDCDAQGVSPVAAIGQDAQRAGYLAGRMMSLLATGPGPLVAVSAHAGDRHIRQRIEGFEAFFRDAPAGKGTRTVIVTECPELESAKDCDRALGKIFRSSPDVAGILVANSSGHIVGDWLAMRNDKQGCAVVSWDLVPANARALREAKIDCVVSQRPAEQAREGLERLFKAVVRGEADASPASIPLEVYFKENIPDKESA